MTRSLRSAALVGGLLLIAVYEGAPAQQASHGTAGVNDNVGANAAAISVSLVALGDSIFHGKAAGGACLMCHGADAKGTPGLAPNLTTSKWLNGDGTYAFIVKTVQNGVPEPKQNPAPMPPMGGAQLTPEQVRAVAAYVYSLTHPELRAPQ
jgi:mono/diheme cytochrome c family protein